MLSRYPFETVEIDGFRGFRNFKLSRLGGVNVLVGGNNCGKTSVLEAISVLCRPAEPQVWMDVIRWRDPGGMDESRLDSLRWCFQKNSIFSNQDGFSVGHCTFSAQGARSTLKLAVNFQEFEGEPSRSELERFNRLNHVYETEQARKLWRGAELSHSFDAPQIYLPGMGTPFVFRFWEDLPIRRTNQLKVEPIDKTECSILSAYSYKENLEQVKSLSLFKLSHDGDDATQVVELLQQFDPDVTAVDIRSTRGLRPAIYLSHRRLGQVPLSIFGDAMRRSVLLASTLSALKPGSVLLIDEAEAGVHVGAQARFFAWLIKVAKQKQVQVFMTTHSLEALDALLSGLPADAADDDLVVYQLHRDGDALASKRFAGDLLHRLRFERGLDLR